MRHRHTLVIVSAVLIVGLAPVLFAGGAVADDPGAVDAQPTQSGLLDELIDSFVGDDSDDESDGGFFESFFGEDESFDGYPDGFSEDGIDDFETALGERSVHYTADSMSYEASATTPDGESFELSARVSADTERALLISETPDGERVQYLDGEEAYVTVDGEYERESASFDRDELYAVTEISRDLHDANLTEATIDGDTVIYTAADRDIELAVRDTGELDYLEIDEEESIVVEFYDYDATTVDEPAWVDDARDVTDEPAGEPEPVPPTTDPVDDPVIQEEIDRRLPDDAEPGTRIQFVTSDGIEVAVVINEDGEPEVIGWRDRADRDGPVGVEPPDRDRGSEEQLRERAELLEERIEYLETQIERHEDRDRTDDRHDADEQIADLERQIDRHQDRIAELEAEIAEIEASDREAELREEITELEDQREALEAERSALRERFDEADDNETREQLRTDLAEIVAELNDVDNELERAERQLDSLDPDAEIAQRRDRIESSEETIATLRERIDRLEGNERAGSTDRIERLEEHKAELEAELDQIEQRLDESSR